MEHMPAYPPRRDVPNCALQHGESSNPTFDLQWDSSFELSTHSFDSNQNDRFHFSLHYVRAATDNPTVKDLIGDLTVDPNFPDSRAT